MSRVNVRFPREVLGKHTSFNVIHPDTGTGPYPVLLQLHGYSDDSYSWLSGSNIAHHVAEYPMIVILPDSGTSRYLNLAMHDRFGLQRYEDLMMRDIPDEVNRVFQVREGNWAIGGLSIRCSWRCSSTPGMPGSSCGPTGWQTKHTGRGFRSIAGSMTTCSRTTGSWMPT